jgi:cytochrome c5
MEVILVTRTVALSALCTFLLFASPQGVSAGEEKKAKKLFESKCSICHSIERPKSKKKTKAEWKSTVMRMKNVNMAPITGEEATTIIDYLAEYHGK